MFVTKDSVIQRSSFKSSLGSTILSFLICLWFVISNDGNMDVVSVCFGAVTFMCADTLVNLLEMLYCRLTGRTIGKPLADVDPSEKKS